MFKIHKYCLVLFLVCCLSACGSPKDYNYFMLHPGSIGPIYDRCWVKTKQQVVVSQECKEVARAARDVKELILEIQRDGQGFGLKIQRAQLRLSKDSKLKFSEEDKLKNKSLDKQSRDKIESELQNLQLMVDEEQLTIKRWYAVLKLMGH